jgi:hypothetical protein
MTVEFTPIETGDMSSIPPDAPAGEWQAVAKVKLTKTSKENLPMIVIDWKLTEALTEGNDDHVGARVSDFLVFRAATDPYVKMSRQQLKAMCDALKIDPPNVTAIRTADDLAEFMSQIEGLKSKIWTILQEDKRTGEMRTSVRYTAPGGGLRAVVDDEEDEKPKGKKAAPAKKTGRR